MSLMAGLKSFELILSIVDKTMDKLPNYAEKKKEEFRKLKLAYENEKKSNYRDDELIQDLQEKILSFLEVFDKEIA